MGNKKVAGKVFLNYCVGGKGRVVYLEITKETYEKLAEEIDTKKVSPLKLGHEDTDGRYFFKAKTSYDVGVYENGESSDIDISKIGKDSEIVLDVKIVEGTFRNTKYVSAYLKNINILSYKESEPYNPFLD